MDYWKILQQKKSELSKSSATASVFRQAGLVFKNFNYYFGLYAATILSLICFLFLIVTTYPALIASVLPAFSVRQMGLFLIALLLISTYILLYLRIRSLVLQWSYFIQANLIHFFTLAYALSVEQRAFNYFVIPALVVIIFASNYYIFQYQKYPFYLLLIVIFIISLQTFSLIGFIVERNLAQISFSQELLNYNFLRSAYFWLILGSFSAAICTLNYLALKNFRKSVILGTVLFLLLSQAFIAVNFVGLISFSYWQKALLCLVFWDFILMPFTIIARKMKDDKFRTRLLVYAGYHGLLILAVFVVANLIYYGY